MTRGRQALASAMVLAALIAGLSTACGGSGPPDAVPGASTPTGTSPAAAAPAGPAPPVEIAALPESEVPRAAIATNTRLRAIRSLAGRTLDTDAIAASEQGVLGSVDALKEWMRTREPRQQTPRTLRSLAREWLVDQETLGSWMATTSRRLDALSAARVELRSLGELWATTEAELEGEAAPGEILERARAVVASIREVETTVSAELEKVLLLESRISGARLDTEEALEQIAAELREGHKALLEIESPPIWRMTGPEAAHEPVREELLAAVTEGGRALRQYAARAPRKLVFQLVLFVLCVGAFHRLRGPSAAWPADDRASMACARLVQRPLLGAALVALLSGLWIHPRAPLAFYELTSILLIVPVVVLLRGIVRPQLRGVLNAVAVIFAVERLWETAWAGSFLERAVLVGLTVFSAAALAWTFGLRAAFPAILARRWWSVATVAGRIALAALVVSLASNVIGNVSLARLLTATVVRASYACLVLYAAAVVLRGAIGLLVRSSAGSVFRTIERHRELVVRRASRAIDAGMVLLFLFFVLTAAGLTPVVRETVGGLLLTPWGRGEFRFSIGSVLVLVGAVYASILLSRLIRAVLEEDVYTRIRLPRGVPSTVTLLVRYTVIATGFLAALSFAGIPIDRLAIVLGAFSVGIGFGLQTVVNNFVSGLILMFERPILVGDAVEVSGLVGRVKRIGVRASTVETFEGAEVIVPNGTLVSGQLINWTLSSRSRRIEIQVGVAYGTEPEKVLALLCRAIEGHPRVLVQPEPLAIFRGFGASSLDFSLFFWTAEFDGWMAVRSDATVLVNRALADAGIEIPFPQHDVRLRDAGAAPHEAKSEKAAWADHELERLPSAEASPPR